MHNLKNNVKIAFLNIFEINVILNPEFSVSKESNFQNPKFCKISHRYSFVILPQIHIPKIPSKNIFSKNLKLNGTLTLTLTLEDFFFW